jgi:ADP-heptose:LPS heptosyltransferase
MAAMRRGDFAAAWRVSDEVMSARAARGEACWRWPRHQQFIWDGRPLAGKRVLVRCYHGLGDTIQFIRFAAPLRRIAARVTVWAQPALVPLIATAPGVDEALPLHDGDAPAVYDADIEIMELPHALRASAARLGACAPYLHPPPLTDCAPEDSPGRRRVGFVWQAGGWDARRSIPTPLIAGLLERLARRGSVAAFVLQRGLPARDLAGLAARDIGSDDVAATAARIRTLDLVVSVDTMAAHLAGALAAPTFTLLHADCDWRWMQGRADSPWYPSMRLFRQSRPGDWRNVIAQVEQALAA